MLVLALLYYHIAYFHQAYYFSKVAVNSKSNSLINLWFNQSYFTFTLYFVTRVLIWICSCYFLLYKETTPKFRLSNDVWLFYLFLWHVWAQLSNSYFGRLTPFQSNAGLSCSQNEAEFSWTSKIAHSEDGQWMLAIGLKLCGGISVWVPSLASSCALGFIAWISFSERGHPKSECARRLPLKLQGFFRPSLWSLCPEFRLLCVLLVRSESQSAYSQRDGTT